MRKRVILTILTIVVIALGIMGCIYIKNSIKKELSVKLSIRQFKSDYIVNSLEGFEFENIYAQKINKFNMHFTIQDDNKNIVFELIRTYSEDNSKREDFELFKILTNNKSYTANIFLNFGEKVIESNLSFEYNANFSYIFQYTVN